MQLSYVNEGSQRTACRVWAEGPKDVIFLHGWLAHSYWWHWVLQGASWAHRALAYDVYGMGHSAWRPAYQFEDHLEQLHQMIETPVDLVGHSYGGLVAYACAARYPKQVRSVVLVDSPLMAWRDHWSVPKLSLASRVTYYQDPEDLYQRFSLIPEQPFPSDVLKKELFLESIKKTDQGYRWLFDPRVLSQPVSNFALLHQAVHVPVVYLASEYSPCSLKEDRSVFLNYAPHAQIIEMPLAQHAILLDRPDCLRACIKDVLCLK